MNRKQLIFFIKFALSVGILVLIYGKVVGREGSGELLTRLADIRWGWVAAAACMQLSAVAVSVMRWDLLLGGQGIHAPFRHLFGSFMIGRFFGAFTPAGLGLQGYRLYDIAVQTGKTARSTATIGIEMVLGWLAFGSVVIAGSIFGLPFLGLEGVLLLDGFFVGLIAVAVLLISRPTLFRLIASRLPGAIRGRLQTTVDAACAYQGRGALVTKAAGLGMGTHAFNNLIYVCAAQALGVDLGIGEVFFASAVQIFSTLMPVSINGIGLREATAVALYTAVGIPPAVAVLIPTLGFAVEMSVSAVGGLIFLSRRVGYKANIVVDNPEHEEFVHQQIEDVDAARWPRPLRGAVVGFAGGLLGGIVVGLAEGGVILASASGDKDLGVLFYGAAAYGLACAGVGLFGGFGLAVSGRLIKRAAVAESLAAARIAGLVVAGATFALGLFRIRRDVYHEMLKLKSGEGLMVAGGCLLAAVVAYFVISTLLRLLLARRPASFALSAIGAPLLLGLSIAGAAATAGAPNASAPAWQAAERTPPPAQAGDVLFIVIDTLRADHLPAYGYEAGETPHLDAFLKDAIRFDQAFANASWTRPSFASLMTGRYPSSHQTTRKADSLPGEIVTLAEAMQQGGYATAGVVTNYNVAPFFNFQQGFDVYSYLEPAFVLGAGDTAAKLLFVQFLRQRIEKVRAASGQVEVGSAYQDAEVVNRHVLELLDRRPEGTPFYLFVGYMDPHDPYYPHPYDGTGYSRAANQKPDPAEAPRLRELYDGEITYWDTRFGELIAGLKQRGVYDDMTIVITADHGEEFMDHGGFWHGTTLYDEQVRVPMLVKLPRAERGGTVVRHWVQGIDVMPTLLARAGLPVPDGVQGQDLMKASDMVFAEEDHEGNVLKALRMRRGLSEIKVIEANEGNPRGLEPYELYRIDQDAHEQVNLAREQGQVLTIAAGALEQRGKRARVGQAARSHVDVGANQAAMQKLRALGYAGGEDP